MLAKRAIALAADKHVARRIELAIMAAGSGVESFASLDALPRGKLVASLLVVHLDGELQGCLPALLERVPEAPVIVILPSSQLELLVDAMIASDRLSGVLVADQLESSALSALVTRAVHGDIFGLEKLVSYGTRIHSTLVGDYQEKSVCIAEISEFASSMHVRRKYRESIEQCVDEMLMNALYDAPVDGAGKQLFADVPTKTRISLRVEQKAVVQYACDGSHFTVSVRDSFGSLGRHTVLRYLHKCLHQEQQIDRKTGGAGLGLYILANSSSQLLFNVLPGVATEAIASFDLSAPKVQLKHFGFFTERIDAAGRLVGGTSQRVPVVATAAIPSPVATRGVMIGLSSAIVLLLGLIALVAYPRFAGAPRGTVRIATSPGNAIVEIDGQIRGNTAAGPLIIDDLYSDRAYKVSARLDGWQSTETIVKPSAGRITEVALSLAARAPEVRIESDPQGATVWLGERQLGETPVVLTELPAGQTVELVFRKAGHQDTTRQLRVPGPGESVVLLASLSMARDVGSVSIRSTPDGAQIYQNGELLAGLATPVSEHLVKGGSKHRFTLKKAGYMPARLVVDVPTGSRKVPVEAVLRPGGSLTITANVSAQLTLSGAAASCNGPLPVRDCPLPDGSYTARLSGASPQVHAEMTIAVRGDHRVHDLQFGFVTAAAGYLIEIRSGRTDRIALLPGNSNVAVIDQATGERRSHSITVTAGRTITVP
jgi:hypothetical protein